ncbi:hypothetical protein NP493_292g02000 [Ridgeia piscesae]|uniref:Uncharacterized protein n=1 Tax=Ridgeia piscesae TaxID=27915 RepID=A0AAD9NWS8_RIDPI|nr:hypothetical protein NP493_292g02000 [Ridgeia piscesae]
MFYYHIQPVCTLWLLDSRSDTGLYNYILHTGLYNYILHTGLYNRVLHTGLYNYILHTDLYNRESNRTRVLYQSNCTHDFFSRLNFFHMNSCKQTY